MKPVAVCVLLATTFALTAHPADPDPIREKLDKAKAVYDAELVKYADAGAGYFEKREESARNEVNKKLVEQIKAQQQAFNELGELPKEAPAALRKLATDAQGKLETAYTEGSAAYFKAKKDAESATVEKEALTLLLKSKRAVYLASMKPYRVVSIKEIDIGRNPQKINNVDFDEAVLMHPGTNKPSEAAYGLNLSYTTLRGAVAVKKHSSVDQKGPMTPATFEIIGNGKSMWKSKPVAVFDESQEFTVNVRGVTTLILRVHCPGINTHCHAHWLDPILVRQ